MGYLHCPGINDGVVCCLDVTWLLAHSLARVAWRKCPGQLWGCTKRHADGPCEARSRPLGPQFGPSYTTSVLALSEMRMEMPTAPRTGTSGVGEAVVVVV